MNSTKLEIRGLIDFRYFDEQRAKSRFGSRNRCTAAASDFVFKLLAPFNEMVKIVLKNALVL